MDFPTTLAKCMESGDLTVSDAARWFDRPRSTVNTWVNGRTPFGPSGRLAHTRLRLLKETVNKKNSGFPIPAALSWTERSELIEEIRDAAERNNGVPKVRAAG